MTFALKSTLLTGLLAIVLAGLSFSQTKKEAKAKSKIEESDLVAPTISPEAREQYNKGYESFEKGDFKKAIKYYKAAIVIDPDYIDAYDNLGLSFRQLGQLDSAACYYRKSIGKYPNGTLSRVNLGQVYSYKREYDNAIAVYREIIVIDSNDAEGYFGIARTYVAKEQFDSAIFYAREALVIYSLTSNPYAGDALFILGVSYYSLGNKEKAKEALEQALDFGFNVPKDLIARLGIEKKKDRVKEYKKFYKNGNVMSLSYYDGFTPVGKWTEYYENGKVLKEFNHENGKPNGVCKYYYDNGQLWTERILKDSENWTVISNFDKKGNPLDAGTLKNGNGTLKLYNEQGELTNTLTYENGKEIKRN